MSRWTREKFRRIILDMHLPDFSPELGRKLDAKRIVDCMAKAGCEALILPAKNHFGFLCARRADCPCERPEYAHNP